MVNTVYNINEIKSLITPILKNTPVITAILFGSYAKGIATKTSDIDLFIDSNGALNGFNFFGVYDILEKKLKKHVDLIEKIDLDYTSTLAEEINKYGVIIYEQD